MNSIINILLSIVTGYERERILRGTDPLANEQQGHPGGR